MELAQCIKNIYAHSYTETWINPDKERLLFKEGNVYPVFAESVYWMTQDEEGERHIIADLYDDMGQDPWFARHFRAL